MQDKQENGRGALEQTAWDLIYLAACALHKIKPQEERVRRMDFKRLFWMCQFHSMTAMVCMALEETEAFAAADPDITNKWKDAKAKAIRKNMLLDAEREQILKEMEQAGIWYMPLKGSVLQAVYPRYGMRQMSDNDILYDAAGQKKLACLMQKRGYETEMCGKSNHDVFMKPPVYNYEMHTSLFGKFSGSAFYGYYSGIKEKLLRDKPDGYGYHFTDEDFYIYMTAHTYKHYNQSGVGLRSLADAYVYLNAKGQDMDLAYIARETKKLGMAEFDSQLRALAEKLFCNPSPGGVSLSAQEEATLSFFVGSGAYGTTKFYVQNRMRELQPEGEDSIWKGRLRFIWRRLFPTMEWYENYEPFVAKHKILIPFFLVYRLFRRLFGRGIKGEIDAMRKYGKKK